MAPLRHAVGLVDDEQIDRLAPQRLEEAPVGELLGRRQDELRRLARDLVEGLVGLAGGQRAVHLRGVEPEPVQLVDLVLHQGDEGRYDERHAGQVQRRQLVTERLARAGRHDGERVPALHRGSDDFLLPWPEFVEAEHAFERAAQGRHIDCASHGRRREQPSCRQPSRACRQATTTREPPSARPEPAAPACSRCSRTLHFARMARRPFPPAVWLLGWVSLLTDAASEAIYPLLPFFLTTRARRRSCGARDYRRRRGRHQQRAADRFGAARRSHRARRRLVIAGYTLSSAARPLIALVTAWWQVLVIRFGDRVGKGVRSAPRDALLAFWADPADRGRVYGFHRAMDHAGAVVGPLVATRLPPRRARPVPHLFLLTAVPGRDRGGARVARAGCGCGRAPSMKTRDQQLSRVRRPLCRTDATGLVSRLPRPFFAYAAVVVIFTLGNSTDAFLLLRLTEAAGGRRSSRSSGHFCTSSRRGCPPTAALCRTASDASRCSWRPG